MSLKDAFGGSGGIPGADDDEEGKIKALQELQEINMEATKLAVDLGKAARDRHDEASHICARPAPTQANGTLPQWPRKHF